MNGAILVAGKAGVGKSTFARMVSDHILAEYYEAYATPYIMPMATQIKRIARSEFGWDGEKDERGRRLLQVLGTDAGRVYNPNIWVDTVINDFDSLIKYTPHAVLISDDIRFDNEIDRICQSSIFICIYTIYIEGPQRVELPGNTAEHESECGLVIERRYSPIIDNTDTLDVLKDHARLWADVVIAGIEQEAGLCQRIAEMNK